jgi:fucose permease
LGEVRGVEESGTWQRRAWTTVLFLAIGISGVSLQARGALIPSFQTTFHVSESELGLLTPLGTIGFVGPVVVVSSLAGRLDMKRALVIGLVTTSAGLILIGRAPNYVSLLGFVALQSAALGIVRALDRPILSHLYPENRGRIFNLETMTWAVGATLGPFLVTWVLSVGEWRLTYYALGVVLLPVAAFAWRLEFPADVVSEQSLTRGDVRPLITNSTILGMGLALVLVGGIESTFFTWFTYYATGFLERSSANLALSVYLAGYVPGRLGFGLLADRVSPPDAVLVAAAVVAGLLVALFGTGGLDRLPFFAVTFAVGLLVSGFFPLLLTWGIEVAPAYTGPVNAFALVSTQVGFFVVPATVGVLADLYSIESAMLVQVVLAVVLVVMLAGRRVLGLSSGAPSVR